MYVFELKCVYVYGQEEMYKFLIYELKQYLCKNTSVLERIRQSEKLSSMQKVTYYPKLYDYISFPIQMIYFLRG